MTDHWPKIKSRVTNKISPWVDLVAREVEFSPGGESQIYHSVKTSGYVNVLAIGPDGRIPLVSQYRPALESFTLELPGGLMDEGEDAATTASRELLEETGFPTRTISSLGVHASDPGRLSGQTHSFFIETGHQVSNFKPETGVTLRLVTPAELLELVLDGTFSAQAHLGTLLQATLRVDFKLPN
jgi:8-oxo-dGTP pyrophosphatase MutT (NUDIX family)